MRASCDPFVRHATSSGEAPCAMYSARSHSSATTNSMPHMREIFNSEQNLQAERGRAESYRIRARELEFQNDKLILLGTDKTQTRVQHLVYFNFPDLSSGSTALGKVRSRKFFRFRGCAQLLSLQGVHHSATKTLLLVGAYEVEK